LEKQAGIIGYVIAKPADNKWRNLREECAKARVHTPLKAGISGGQDGAYSIVMSGGYSDDIDNGENMCATDPCFFVHFVSPVRRVYTGAGGRGDEGSWGGGEQTQDQTFDHKDNNALYVRSQSLADDTGLNIVQVSFQRNRPVRVIRGHQLNSKYAPWDGFVTDNLSLML